MEKLLVHPTCCKGCGYCEAACRKEAISLSGPINKAGYVTPVVDSGKCILCGMCYNVCPDYVYEIAEEGVH